LKILAVDTATKSCSAAVTEDRSLLAELTTVREQTHSKHLLRTISAVIEKAGLHISNIDGFALTTGPGSFTGLRIGMSTIKGLALALEKPVVGVSTLDALAMQGAPARQLICPLLDARKGEVYCARYRFVQGVLQKEGRERVLPPDKALADIHEPCLFLGDGAQLYRSVIQTTLGENANFSSPASNTIRAFTVARLSVKRFGSNDPDDPAGLVPCYIRRSEAELNFRKKPPTRR
jgi:tRNA threonylcarbamoyladenosine biosynthesis protein TsaB